MIVIQKKELIPKLKALKPSIGTKLTQNTEGLLFKENMMIADNHDYTLSMPFEFSGTPFILPKTAIEMLDNLPDGEVRIEPSDKDVTIKSRAGTSKFSTVPFTQFHLSSTLQLINPNSEIVFSACTISDMLSRVVYACASDNSVHSGILLDCDGETVNAVAMDGYRLAWSSTKNNMAFRAVIPAVAVRAFISLCQTGSVKVVAGEKSILLQTDDFTISTRQLKGNFVDYNAAVPKNYTSHVAVDRAELIAALTPRELYSAMGFPATYIIDVDTMGRAISRKDQVARCGNAVPPPLAAAMVLANLPEWCMAA